MSTMADSDDDFGDRRRRDKFRSERSEYQDRVTGSGGRRDDGWTGRSTDQSQRDTSGWGSSRLTGRLGTPGSNSGSYGAGSSGAGVGRRYGSPGDRSGDMSPPMKRNRMREWSNDSYGGSSYGAVQNPWDMMDNSYGNGQSMRNDDNGPTQPPMMTFKQFMAGLDDSIDHLDAAKKYNEYKIEFKRKQIVEFFNSHKDEEWFKIKYHPEDSIKRKAQMKQYLEKRKQVYMDLLNSGLVDSVSIDVEKADQIVNVLDSAVIKLEGGSDFDLKSLDESYDPLNKPKEPGLFLFTVDVDKNDTVSNNVLNNNGVGNAPVKDESEPVEPQTVQESMDVQVKQEKLDDQDDATEQESGVKSEEAAGDEEKMEHVPIKQEIEEEKQPELEAEAKVVVKQEKDDDGQLVDNEALEGEITNDEGEVTNDVETGEVSAKEDTEMAVQQQQQQQQGEEYEQQDMKQEEDAIGSKKSEVEQVDALKPRPLHKTASIFLRYLPSNITKAEVESMFKKYPEFLRVAIADPAFEKRFQRRGWVTFERSVDIRKIYLSLNNVRIRECELGAIINRDLSRRIRSVNGIASHKNNVLADIKHATRIILTLDQQKKVWDEDEDEDDTANKNNNNNNDNNNTVLDASTEAEVKTVLGIPTKNPLLKNITDYLIEEASAEEEELLGGEVGEIESDESGQTLQRDENLIRVLDRLLLYLRIVHSLDYYNHIDYPLEDEMPNRIGIMHARGMPPSCKVTTKEVTDYIKQFEGKIAPYLHKLDPLSEDEADKLGRKNAEAEVEQFINDNTQELAKDKWLCPLSGKKFKGPSFVRKHIENKHAERLEQVKKETDYFNNYLLDPKRPQLPEHPVNRPPSAQTRGQSKSSGSGSMDHMSSSWPGQYGSGSFMPGFQQRSGQMGYGASYGMPMGAWNPDMRGNFNSYGRMPQQQQQQRYNPRKRTYRDLDAPLDDML